MTTNPINTLALHHPRERNRPMNVYSVTFAPLKVPDDNPCHFIENPIDHDRPDSPIQITAATVWDAEDTFRRLYPGLELHSVEELGKLAELRPNDR